MPFKPNFTCGVKTTVLILGFRIWVEHLFTERTNFGRYIVTFIYETMKFNYNLNFPKPWIIYINYVLFIIIIYIIYRGCIMSLLWFNYWLVNQFLPLQMNPLAGNAKVLSYNNIDFTICLGWILTILNFILRRLNVFIHFCIPKSVTPTFPDLAIQSSSTPKGLLSF